MTREEELRRELKAIERAKYDAIYHNEAPKMRMKFEGKYFGFTYRTGLFYKLVYIDWIDLSNACISLTSESLAFDCHGWSFEEEETTNGELMFKIIPKEVLSSMDMNNAIAITKEEFYKKYERTLKILGDLK